MLASLIDLRQGEGIDGQAFTGGPAGTNPYAGTRLRMHPLELWVYGAPFGGANHPPMSACQRPPDPRFHAGCEHSDA